MTGSSGRSARGTAPPARTRAAGLPGRCGRAGPGRAARGEARPCPAASRDTSSRSSMMRVMCPTCRAIIARACSTTWPSCPDAWRSCRPLRMGARGLRSSWASIITNWSFRLSASRSFSSIALISQMSRVAAATTRAMRPVAVRSGTTRRQERGGTGRPPPSAGTPCRTARPLATYAGHRLVRRPQLLVELLKLLAPREDFRLHPLRAGPQSPPRRPPPTCPAASAARTRSRPRRGGCCTRSRRPAPRTGEFTGLQ